MSSAWDVAVWGHPFTEWVQVPIHLPIFKDPYGFHVTNSSECFFYPLLPQSLLQCLCSRTGYDDYIHFLQVKGSHVEGLGVLLGGNLSVF